MIKYELDKTGKLPILKVTNEEDKSIICWRCAGIGRIYNGHMKLKRICPVCSGDGELINEDYDPDYLDED
jgi:uncharacterized protein (DUF983 family)